MSIFVANLSRMQQERQNPKFFLQYNLIITRDMIIIILKTITTIRSIAILVTLSVSLDFEKSIIMDGKVSYFIFR